MGNINLNWLRAFEAAARLSGFSSAARELGLTQVAVSKQIRSLEVKLGHDLFIRRAKKVELTEVGRAYLPSVREGLEKLSQATYGIFGTDIDETIVVRSSIALSSWLAPRLAEFQHQYPHIKLKFVTSIWPDPINAQKVDIDISLLSNGRHTSASEKLSDEYLVPICGQQTLNKVSSLHDLRELESIHIVGFDDHWSRYMANCNTGTSEYSSTAARVQVDTSILACELVASGKGCAVLIERFAKRAIEAGRAIHIVGQPVALNQSHVFVKPAGAHGHPVRSEVEAFKQWIRDEFQASEVPD